MTTDELDLARAMEIAWVHFQRTYEGNEYSLSLYNQETWWAQLTDRAQDGILSCARAIRLGDEARGLRVVPVEPAPTA